jgi:SAM-dependent methyltransferase
VADLLTTLPTILRDTFKKITPAWALPAARALYHRSYRAQLRLRFLWTDLVSKPNAVLPPARLRFRVSETLDPALFQAVGQNAAGRVRELLAEAQRPPEDTRKVLEFGCGCGRVVAPLSAQFPQVSFWGTDVDGEAIEWCSKNIPRVDFQSNGELPPLPYPAGFFDVIYCISVFTHLDDRHTRLWLEELDRILRPGGTLLLTIHGEHVWRKLASKQQEDVARHGVLFETTAKLKGIQPEWYQTSYHAAKYILDLVGDRFEVVLHVPQGMGYQDAVVAVKPATLPTHPPESAPTH